MCITAPESTSGFTGRASTRANVRRESDLAEIPNLRIPKKANKDEKIDEIVRNLVGRGHARPRKVKTLQNTINNLISEPLTEKELAALVKELQIPGKKIEDILKDTAKEVKKATAGRQTPWYNSSLTGDFYFRE